MKKSTYTRDEILDILLKEEADLDYEIKVCYERNDDAGAFSRKAMQMELNTLKEIF